MQASAQQVFPMAFEEMIVSPETEDLSHPKKGQAGFPASDTDIEEKPYHKTNDKGDRSDPETDGEHLQKTRTEGQIFCYRDVVREKEDHGNCTKERKYQGTIGALKKEIRGDEQDDNDHIGKPGIECSPDGIR